MSKFQIIWPMGPQSLNLTKPQTPLGPDQLNNWSRMSREMGSIFCLGQMSKGSFEIITPLIDDGSKKIHPSFRFFFYISHYCHCHQSWQELQTTHVHFSKFKTVRHKTQFLFFASDILINFHKIQIPWSAMFICLFVQMSKIPDIFCFKCPVVQMSCGTYVM